MLSCDKTNAIKQVNMCIQQSEVSQKWSLNSIETQIYHIKNDDLA